MSETPTKIPMMPPEKARDIARGFKSLAQDYVDVGMTRDAARYERESLWWLAYAVTLANTKPGDTST